MTIPSGGRKTEYMVTILLTLNAFICVALIILILLQRSDPASGGMFGGAGGGGQPVVRNPLAKPTAILAGLFLVFSVVTAILNKGEGHGETIMSTATAPATPTLPEAALLPTSTTTPVEAVPSTAPISPTE
ncbi:MAG: preprotein translocase subunit SecG [Pseudomonas fluorescens]|nr:MAG: preprotein translocase subunit SecG [Pseudomonas fluorescens]